MKISKTENYSVAGYITTFGKLPDDKDLGNLTQTFMKAYHRVGTDPYELVNGFGIDWLELLLKYNETHEEYELCSIFRDLINDYKQK
jgi:hypothetical protein